MRKLLICPYFGDLPEWYPHWQRNTERMEDHGYDFLFESSETAFRERVRSVLGIEAPSMWGTGNIWDFRPAFGVLYADELRGFDFWGHTDFDCVYGRVERWVTDEFLSRLDVHSNHDDYVCGPWTLYRNDPRVNELFRQDDEWKDHMEGARPSGWAEVGFTRVLDAAHRSKLVRRRYTKWQTQSQENFDGLLLHADGRLMDGKHEAMMAHFKRTKVYPEGCKL